MALRVHALLVMDVVALLYRAARVVCSARAGECAAREADAGTDSGARIAAHQAARSGADRGTDYCVFRRGVVRRLRRGGAAKLRRRELPAFVIVETELVETLVRPRQHHHARTIGRRRGAAREERNGSKSDNGALHRAGAGVGGTAFQPPGQSLTYG